jgi:hypothetical protein
MLLALICVLMIRHPESSSHNKPQAASAGAP